MLFSPVFVSYTFRIVIYLSGHVSVIFSPGYVSAWTVCVWNESHIYLVLSAGVSSLDLFCKDKKAWCVHCSKISVLESYLCETDFIISGVQLCIWITFSPTMHCKYRKTYKRRWLWLSSLEFARRKKWAGLSLFGL